MPESFKKPEYLLILLAAAAAAMALVSLLRALLVPSQQRLAAYAGSSLKKHTELSFL